MRTLSRKKIEGTFRIGKCHLTKNLLTINNEVRFFARKELKIRPAGGER